MSSLSLDAHIIIPKSETVIDALISGAVQKTVSIDAIVYGPAEVKFDAILVSSNRSHKSVSTKVRPAAFRGAIFSQDA